MFEPGDFVDENPVSSQLIKAVTSGDLPLLKSLITPETPLQEITDSEQDTLLHIAIRHEEYARNKTAQTYSTIISLNILEYLLNLNRMNLNAFNSLGRTPLLMAAAQVNPRFVELLVKHGADANLADSENNTPLHYAAYYNFFRNCTLLLENGAKINAQNNHGVTVLHLVCAMRHDVEWVAMLLFYGADATIPAWESHKIGYTPFELALFHDKDEFQEILFDYVFDGIGKIHIALGALVAAMEFGSKLFPRILENVDDVIFDWFELDVFIRKIFYFHSDYLRLFIRKFSSVLEAVSCHCYIMYVMRVFIVQHSPKFLQSYEKLIENFYILFDTPSLPYFVDNINDAPRPGTLSSFIRCCHKRNLSFHQMTQMIYHVLSYGVNLRDEDMDNIYLCFGDNKLFRDLLFMDITKTRNYNEKPPLPTLIHDVTSNISTFYKNPILYDVTVLEKVVDYFTDVRLRELCLLINNDSITCKIQKLPKVPSLLQLSRDASRNFIVKTYNVNSSSHFYTILKAMPISRAYKAIIAFESKLYCLS